MKTLYIIRHAKSSWADFTVDDFDRSLNERGLRDAPDMALRLKEKQVQPDLLLSSPAKRAKETALFFKNVLAINESMFQFDATIYEASLDTLTKIIKSIPATVDSCMLVGHNPGLTYLVNDIASVHIDNIPTCGIAAIQFQCEWNEVSSGTGSLIWFDYPKSI